MNRIMQLPDCCFGRRWPVIFSFRKTTVGVDYFISEIGLPDKCVLWELFIKATSTTVYVTAFDILVSLALGDNLPTTDAEFIALENMFPEADEFTAGVRLIRGYLHLTRLRKPYTAQGRRSVLRTETLVEQPNNFVVGLIFSSIPTEVPDCLLSAHP